MITGVHAVLFTPDAEGVRAFLRDTLELRSVDAGGGWLIFGLPPAELAAHPAEAPGSELYLMCDDLEATMADLRSKGVELGPVSDQGWGRLTTIALPDGGELGLYEPRHPRP
jgi:catechol 2,3-dioxygenase-like lactoylglutathione lyase family enzyme